MQKITVFSLAKNISLIGSFSSEDEQNIASVAVSHIEDMAASNQEIGNIRREIESLPPKQRLALILRRYEELSYE